MTDMAFNAISPRFAGRQMPPARPQVAQSTYLTAQLTAAVVYSLLGATLLLLVAFIRISSLAGA